MTKETKRKELVARNDNFVMQVNKEKLDCVNC